MSQNKSQLISFILYKPLQVTLSRNTYQLNVGKVPKRKRSHINSIKQMNMDMQIVSGLKNFLLQLAGFQETLLSPLCLVLPNLMYIFSLIFLNV